MTLILLILTFVSACLSQEPGFPEEPIYSDDYGDIDYPEYLDVHRINFTIYKCYCSVEDVWNSSCSKSHEKDILHGLQGLNQYFNYFDDLSNVTEYFQIQNVQCSKKMLTIRPSVTGDNIFISDYGELYYQEAHIIVPPSDFCIEFRDGEDGVQLEADICVPDLGIPKCCSSIDNCLSDFKSAATIGNHKVEVDEQDFLSSSLPQCQGDKQLTKISLLDKTDGQTDFHYRSDATDLLWDPENIYSTPQIFTTGDYCISQDNDRSPSALFCYLDPLVAHQNKCKDAVCIRKCCNKDEIFDVLSLKCSLAEEKFPFFDKINFYKSDTKLATSIPDDLIMEYSYPWCSNGTYLIDPTTNPKDGFYLLDNGSLLITLSNVAVPPKQYCIENFVDENSTTPKVISCFLDVEEEEVDKCKIVHSVLYPILLVVSCTFLCITLIVYASIPELHAKLHGKSLISHVSSLLGAFICQLIVNWSSKSLSMIGCKIIGLANQLMFLWAFFWLNVMCFDIWWTLKTMSPRPETGENTRKRFIYYSIYAWGTPVLLCSFTALMEFLPASVDTSHLLLPGFGIRGCWFQDMYSTWVYFHGFTLFLYVTNILFFFHVAAILIKEQRLTEGILRPTWKQHKERVWLYLKLFVVMGITWICEVASWQEGTCEYWIFTDIINSLQGVFIFFIFMCNRKVFQKIQSKGPLMFQRLKIIFKSPSPKRTTGGSTSSRRTTGTSVESSSRRLSTSLQPALKELNLETIKENDKNMNKTMS